MDISTVSDWLEGKGVRPAISGYLSYTILIIGIILICVIVNLILKKIVLKILARIILRNKHQWDDVLIDHKIFNKLANIFPGIILYIFAPMFPELRLALHRISVIYIIIIIMFVINSLLNAIGDIYRLFPISNVRPIKGLLQVIKIILFIISGIIIVGTLMNQNPLLMLGGIGALTAVISLVFKDSILGFIAGIQLTANDMLRIGDWIEMAKYGADGDVVDITLNTVKVQNFDKTIVTVPAYALVSDSFKNYRGMKEFGGRRIKRAINIDVNSITFCTPQMLDKFKKINYLRDYIIEKEKELGIYNERFNEEKDSLINGKHMTNVGTFRAYIQLYLNNNTELRKGMTLMARQLPPGETGLPIEIYAFTNTTKWEDFETIQADIFDHILSVVEEFELRIFQNPSGYDMKLK